MKSLQCRKENPLDFAHIHHGLVKSDYNLTACPNVIYFKEKGYDCYLKDESIGEVFVLLGFILLVTYGAYLALYSLFTERRPLTIAEMLTVVETNESSFKKLLMLHTPNDIKTKAETLTEIITSSATAPTPTREGFSKKAN